MNGAGKKKKIKVRPKKAGAIALTPMVRKPRTAGTTSSPKEKGSVKNRRFLQEYHDDVIRTNRIGTEPRTGKSVTMHLGTFGTKDETYVLPTYNPATRKDYPGFEALDKFLPAIKAGKIEGFSTVAKAEYDLKVNREEILERTRRERERKRKARLKLGLRSGRWSQR